MDMPPAAADISDRRYRRVPGPFEGWWLEALPVAVDVRDLSAGGCLIQSYHEPTPGTRLTLELDVPFLGAVTFTGVVLYVRAGYGFAVEFVDLPPALRVTLDEVATRLLREMGPAADAQSATN